MPALNERAITQNDRHTAGRKRENVLATHEIQLLDEESQVMRY